MLKDLSHCRVVEGFVQILLIDQNDTHNFENISFPLLTEITDFLLVFRVKGLKSIGQLFPNLAVIRGRALFNNYALVVYEVFDLEEIALKSLIHIGRGAVRVEKNPNLCHVDSIDWTKIAHNTKADDSYFVNNRRQNDCPLCSPNTTDVAAMSCTLRDKQSYQKYQCWNRNLCQRICPDICPGNCDEFGKCCDEQCLGGCIVKHGSMKVDNCTACRYFSLGDFKDRKCVDKCPPEHFQVYLLLVILM